MSGNYSYSVLSGIGVRYWDILFNGQFQHCGRVFDGARIAPKVLARDYMFYNVEAGFGSDLGNHIPM